MDACDDEALRLGPREEVQVGSCPHRADGVLHHREDHSALGSKAGEMRPRTPEGLKGGGDDQGDSEGAG